MEKDMDRRVFLGWGRALLGALVDWLRQQGDEITGMLVVVPTAQAGRRLREALAERGACLAPRVMTPGQLLVPDKAPGRALEVAAWVEALERVKDWDSFEAIFPLPPGEGEPPGWALSLARSLVDLERSLRESALTLELAARRLETSVEADRWAGLGELARRRDAVLKGWGWRNENLLLREAPPLSGRVVMAGVWDFPDALIARLEGAELSCLVAAPQEEAEAFDAWGRPLQEAWECRELAWPAPGGVELAAHARHQAHRAVARVAAEGTASDELALVCADDETASELVRAFADAGWKVHDPGAIAGAGARGWLKAWRAFVQRPQAAEAMDLLACAPTAALVGGRRAQRVHALSRLRSGWLVRDAEDVARVAGLDGRLADAAGLAAETLERLEGWRATFIGQPFEHAMGRLLERLDPGGAWTEVRELVGSLGPLAGQVGRPSAFWLDLIVAELADEKLEPPEGRVADVEGWLELLHARGQHLVLCGMNEGRVPSTAGANQWMSEPVRRSLGLVTETVRGARDAYVLRAALEARREGGRVDLFLAKSGGDGDALLPSRLLLAASGEELARRVQMLFAEVEPPDAAMPFEVDWRWRPQRGEVRVKEGQQSLSVSAFKDYLACPFRFYLKHGRSMRAAEPERFEWDALDFGNVAHEILEAWGQDPEARDLGQIRPLNEYFDGQVEAQLERRFGHRVPLAVRMQAESLRQRLRWFASWQVAQHAEGWRVLHTEEPFEREIAGVTVRGTIDRIDGRDGARRVLDYKTFAKKPAGGIEGAHRRKLSAASQVPAHLVGVEEVGRWIGQGDKAKEFLWTDLQVPLYAVALGDVAELGYYVLASSEEDSGALWWKDFGEADSESALRCAEWVLEQVKAGAFWPPAERVRYDDFKALAVGRQLQDLVVEPEGWRDEDS
jgi:ATP-dependent helicase/nuclease subunit B